MILYGEAVDNKSKLLSDGKFILEGNLEADNSH
jgi:hypothetical protein